MSFRVYSDEIELSPSQLLWVAAGNLSIRIDRTLDNGSVGIEVWSLTHANDPIHIFKYSEEA